MIRLGVFAGVVAAIGASAWGQVGVPLAKKAQVFEQDLQRRFTLEGQALCKLHVPTAQRPDMTYNMPDNAYMTGIVAGALSWKFAVTKDPADREAANGYVRGLNLLSTVSGKKGVLARAAWPKDRTLGDDGGWRDSPDGKHVWRGDVSSDQMTGVMFGYALAFDRTASDGEKKEIARNVADLVGVLLDNGLKILDVDGKPTQFGKYMPAYVRLAEPMNALLLLQHLQVAEHVTGDERFAKEYRRIALDEGYAQVAVQVRHMWGRVNYSDDVLLFLAYYPLIKYETDAQLKALYVNSLQNTWEGTKRRPGAKVQGNPLYAFMMRDLAGDDAGVAAGIDTLKWFPFDLKWNRGTIAGYEKEFGFTYDPRPASPEPKPGGPVPPDRRRKTWSAWVQDPFAEAGERTADDPMEYNGHDYLVAYWLGRYLGVISPEM